MDSGKFTSEFIIEKGEQEIETKMVLKLDKIIPDLKDQKFKILQTSGIFKKNSKGMFIFVDENERKYFISNKMIKDKIGDMTDEKVKVNKDNGASFLTFIKSVNSLEVKIIVLFLLVK